MEMRAAEEQLECLLRHLARLIYFQQLVLMVLIYILNSFFCCFVYWVYYCTAHTVPLDTQHFFSSWIVATIFDHSRFNVGYNFEHFVTLICLIGHRGSLSGKCFAKEFQKIKKELNYVTNSIFY